MTNELVTLEQVDIAYTPATLQIKNKDVLDQAIEAFISKYEGIVVTEETLKDAKDSKAKVNALKKALEDKRKEQKRLYNEPLNKFEKEIKANVEKLDQVYQSINEGVKFFEEQKREERKKEIEAKIAEISELNGVDPQTVEFRKSWLNATPSMAKKTEEIVEAVQKQKRINKDVQAIQEYCLKLNLPATRYIEIARDFDYWEAKKAVDADHEHLMQQKEAERAAKQAEVERQKEQLVEVGDKQVDSETGEVVQEFQIVSFKLKGTKQDLDNLAMMIQNSAIEVLEASERELVIERK
ncbi:DUF1351 domain-containing protein [Ligilactobacillus murinus]|uniref:DUF1351 domain-containing protein n=1 Tax=Ligilactobacillus murinus TaxID=1622 RepID=UPI0012984815|nr:DUF1351 domain-containing protein [Ligilactobacillus murinus]